MPPKELPREGGTFVGERDSGVLRSNAVVLDTTDTTVFVDGTISLVLLESTDGLPILVHQGARAFVLWTGFPAPVETMLVAARAARAGS